MFNKKRKGLLSIALSAILLMGTFNGIYKPYEVYAIEDYHSWRQTDERWASIPIGNTTIGASGCLVTSISIMAAHSGSVDTDNFNPGLFASALNGINGFDAYGSLKWAAVNAVIPDVQIMGVKQFESYDETGKAEEIRSAMEDGYYVICYVGNHWVFVEDVCGNDVYMIDPAKDNVLLFDTYSNYNITQYEILTGQNEPSFSANQITSAVTTSFTTTEPVTTTTEIISETTTETTTTSTTEFIVEETTTSTEETTISQTTTQTSESTISETTTTTITSAISQTTEISSSSEFYYSGEESTFVYTTSGEVLAEIQNGNMLNVREINGNYGLVTINGVDGWIDMSQMVFNLNWGNRMKGDINGDGVINLYDLSLLNDYLKSLKTLPEGVSILSKSEIEIADINEDGVTDNLDVIEYLSIICK